MDKVKDKIASIGTVKDILCACLTERSLNVQVLIPTCGDKVFKAEKALVFLPDAIGNHLWEIRPEWLKRVAALAPHILEVEAAYPSVTPVCFATMFTGLTPAEHGISRYEKPVLQVETAFDILVQAGKRVALVAVQNSSMDLIFRGRAISYFSMPDDFAVEEQAMNLMNSENYDVVVAYQQAYDDNLHAYGVFSQEALNAAEEHISSFEKVFKVFMEAWKGYKKLILFAPDHGAHNVDGRGTHGDNVPSDMQLKHFYGFY